MREFIVFNNYDEIYRVKAIDVHLAILKFGKEIGVKEEIFLDDFVYQNFAFTGNFDTPEQIYKFFQGNKTYISLFEQWVDDCRKFNISKVKRTFPEDMLLHIWNNSKEWGRLTFNILTSKNTNLERYPSIIAIDEIKRI